MVFGAFLYRTNVPGLRDVSPAASAVHKSRKWLSIGSSGFSAGLIERRSTASPCQPSEALDGPISVEWPSSASILEL